MADNSEFERLTGWIGRLQSSVGLAVAERAASETLLDSAEYELAQLRRDFVLTAPAGGARRTGGRYRD